MLDVGPLAHLVERLICNEEVAGSSPARSTKKRRGLRKQVLFFVDLVQKGVGKTCCFPVEEGRPHSAVGKPWVSK